LGKLQSHHFMIIIFIYLMLYVFLFLFFWSIRMLRTYKRKRELVIVRQKKKDKKNKKIAQKKFKKKELDSFFLETGVFLWGQGISIDDSFLIFIRQYQDYSFPDCISLESSIVAEKILQDQAPTAAELNDFRLEIQIKRKFVFDLKAIFKENKKNFKKAINLRTEILFLKEENKQQRGRLPRSKNKIVSEFLKWVSVRKWNCMRYDFVKQQKYLQYLIPKLEEYKEKLSLRS